MNVLIAAIKTANSSFAMSVQLLFIQIVWATNRKNSAREANGNATIVRWQNME
jgi:hypothetical protein